MGKERMGEWVSQENISWRNVWKTREMCVCVLGGVVKYIQYHKSDFDVSRHTIHKIHLKGQPETSAWVWDQIAKS